MKQEAIRIELEAASDVKLTISFQPKGSDVELVHVPADRSAPSVRNDEQITEDLPPPPNDPKNATEIAAAMAADIAKLINACHSDSEEMPGGEVDNAAFDLVGLISLSKNINARPYFRELKAALEPFGIML